MMMVENGFAQISDCGFRVFTSVVSRANNNRGILDAGSKTLTSDTGGLKGFGYISEHPKANIIKFSEEHGFLELKDCKNKPSVGDIVYVKAANLGAGEQIGIQRQGSHTIDGEVSVVLESPFAAIGFVYLVANNWAII